MVYYRLSDRHVVPNNYRVQLFIRVEIIQNCEIRIGFTRLSLTNSISTRPTTRFVSCAILKYDENQICSFTIATLLASQGISVAAPY